MGYVMSALISGGFCYLWGWSWGCQDKEREIFGTNYRK